MMDQIRTLFAHLAWADAEALAALKAADEPPARAVRLYAHVAAAEHVWLSRLRGRAPRVAVWPELDLEQAAALAAENAGDLAAYVDTLSADDLPREIVYRNSAGDEFRSAIGDVLMHVCLHGSYHRGQVAMLLRDAGAEPRPTDYIAFTRGAPAARSA
jgi:uncharacterized damage-inducible protein DinB